MCRDELEKEREKSRRYKDEVDLIKAEVNLVTNKLTKVMGKNREQRMRLKELEDDLSRSNCLSEEKEQRSDDDKSENVRPSVSSRLSRPSIKGMSLSCASFCKITTSL
jgi:predicted ribosome quality control (RQC) complex YloA/Tae2 family protein